MTIVPVFINFFNKLFWQIDENRPEFCLLVVRETCWKIFGREWKGQAKKKNPYICDLR